VRCRSGFVPVVFFLRPDCSSDKMVSKSTSDQFNTLWKSIGA
jgi:hypothetical protein